jgi:PAS domain S-box-containing protein
MGFLNGIQGRLTLYSLLFALIPLLIVGVLSFTAARDSLRQEATTVTSQLLESVSTDIQTFFFERRGDIRVMANAETLRDRDLHGSEAANEYLKEVKAAYGVYLTLIATDTSGRVTAASDLVSNDMTGERWFKDAIRGIASVSDVYYLTSIQRMVVTIASPMIGENGEIVGTIAGHIDAKVLFDIAERAQTEQGGEVLFVNTKGRVSIDGETEDIFFDLSDNPAVQAGLRGESGSLIAIDEEGNDALMIYSPSEGTQNWVALATISLEALDAPVNDLAGRLVLAGVLVTAVVIVAVIFLSRQFVRPIQDLTHTARLLSNGDLDAPITVQSRDEIGALGNAFRYMAAQLRELIDSLEERVNARTRDLQAVADVSTQIATVLEPETLLTDVANLTKERFGFYHAHIYLLNPAEQRLTMEGGAGEAGQVMKANKHAIALSRQHSLVVRAATSGKPVIANDVSKEPDFLPNPLLPLTRSEMAIPMKIGERVIGVLDVQSDALNTFAEDNARVMQTLANQIAVAAENAGAFQRIQESQKALLDMRFALDQHSIVAITDQRGIIQYANDKFSEISGYSIDELIGQDHRIINSGYHSKEFIRNLWTTVANGKVWHGEFQNRAKDGHTYWVDTSIIPFLNEQGKPFQYIAIRTDITERKRQEAEIARRATELEVAAQVSAATTSILDMDELLLTVSNLTKEAFGLYHAHIYLLDGAGENLVLAAGAGDPGQIMKQQGRRIALNHEHSLVARAAREKVGVIANDVTQEPDFLPNPLLPNTRSEMAIPMIIGEHVIGVLDVQADIVNRFDADDVRVKSALANQVAVAVENARAFERIEESEYELKKLASFQDAVLNGANYSIISTDLDGTILSFNSTAERMLGYQAEEVVGKTTPSIFHDADEVVARAYVLTEELGLNIEPGFDVFVVKPRLQGLPDENEWTYIHKNGSRFPVLLSVTTIRDSAGNITGYTGIATDITQRKEAQVGILKARQRAETLAKINAALSQAVNEDEILAAIAPLAEAQGVMLSSLSYALTEGELLVGAETAALRRGDGQPVPLSMLPSARSMISEIPLLGLMNSQSDEPLLLEDIMSDPLSNESTRSFAQAIGVQSAVVIPLRSGSEWHGVLSFTWLEPQRFSQETRNLFKAIMPTATSVVAARRAFLESQRQRAEAEKRAVELAIVAEVSSTAATQLNPTELLSSVVELTKGAFNLYHAHIYLADEENASLVLAAGAGEAGRIMLQQGRRIAMDHPNSLVAAAGRDRRPMIANDVTQEVNFLPNPLLPETRSEMSVPMVLGNKLVGVLDVQANHVNHFTETDALIFRTLGDQLAIAIENARAFQIQQETAERLREVDRLKSQFLANMSHELRTPLNSIIGYSEVLLDGLDGDLSEDAIEDVEAIHNGGKHLLSIINDVLDLAKIEAGQMLIDRREADVATVIEDVVSTVQILIKDKPDLVLEVHVPDNLPTVYGDMLRMKQMMMNLVNNAIKFTESGSVRIEAAPHNGHEVVISVTDTGIGMNEHEMAGLFQQFHQVDGSPTRRAGGTGLGLVITRHLIHMHDGEIYVDSEKGVGTRFWFTLPTFAERMAERA